MAENFEDNSSNASSDELYLEVMKTQLEIINANQKLNLTRYWRIISKKSSDCELCKEPGGVVLLNCANEKCSTAYHLECAFHDGDLILDDENILHVSCSNHSQSLVFCSCKEKYDDTRPMVYCDECCDWFHNSCEGLHEKAAMSTDTYVCKSCKALLKQGKSISKSIKDKNYAKECRSSFQQAANKAIGLLLELSRGLCPIIDEISIPGNNSQFTTEEIQEALDILSKSPFTNEGIEIDSERYIQTLGVQPLINKWKLKLSDYIQVYNEWYTVAMNLYQEYSSKLVINFSIEQIEMYANMIADFKQHLDVFNMRLIGIPSNLNGFFVFYESIQIIHSLLQILHENPKSENWYIKIASTIRNAITKQKSFHILNKDYFVSSISSYYLNYFNYANDLLNNMKAWYSQVYKILYQNLEYNLSDLEEFLNSANDFPTKPLLYEDLSSLIQDALKLELDITNMLNNNEVNEDLIQELYAKQNDLGIILPSDEKFDIVNNRLIFLKAFQMSIHSNNNNNITTATTNSNETNVSEYYSTTNVLGTNDLRLSLDIVLTLLNEASNLMINNLSSNINSPLSELLDIKVKDAVKYLSNLKENAMKVVLTIDTSILSLDNINTDIIIELKKLKVITPEEELFDCFQSLKLIKDEMINIVPSQDNNTHVNEILLSELSNLIDKLELSLLNKIIDVFEVAKHIRNDMNKYLSDLKNQLFTSEKLWNIVSNAVIECEQGISNITLEEMKDNLNNANNSKIIDENIRVKALELINIGETIALECTNYFANSELVYHVNEQSILEIEDLYLKVSRCPVPSGILQKVLIRKDVYSVVRDSTELLLLSVNDHNNDIIKEESFLTNYKSDKDMVIIREIHNRIVKLNDKYDRSLLFEPDLTMFLSIKDEMLLHCWVQEVRYLLNHPSSLQIAEKLIQNGEKIGFKAKETIEWKQIVSEVEKATNFITNCDRCLQVFQELKKESSIDINNEQVTKLLGNRTPLVLPNWTNKSLLLEEELKKLLEINASLKIKQSNIYQKIKESLDLIMLVNSVHKRVNAIHLILYQNDYDESDNIISNDTISIIDLTEVTSFTNQLTFFADREQQSFTLLSMLLTDMKSIYTESCKWNEQLTSLLPIKSTRSKLKSDTNLLTKEILLAKLNEPIARVVNTPIHQKIYSTLNEAEKFRIRLVNFLLCKDSYTSITSSDNSINYQSEDFQTILDKDLIELNEMKDTINLMLLDMNEFKVLHWISEVFDWISSVPYPGDDPSTCSISFEYAQRKLQESEPIIANVSPVIMDILNDLNIVNLDVNKGTIGFQPSTHPVIRIIAAEVRENLEEKFEQNRTFQNKIINIIFNKQTNQSRSKDLTYLFEAQSLQKTYNTLLIEVPSNVKKALDKFLQSRSNLLTGIATTTTTSDTEENEDIDDHTNAVPYEYWSHPDVDIIIDGLKSSVNKKTSRKRTKEALDSLVALPPGSIKKDITTVTTSTAAAVADKKNKQDIGLVSLKKQKVITTHTCLNPDCSNPIKKDSNYCSSDCIINATPFIYDALLRYRKLLCIYGGSLNNILAVEDPLHILKAISKMEWNAYAIGFHNLNAFEKIISSDVNDVTPMIQHDKKTGGSYIQNILQTLPPAAGPVLWRGDTDEMAIYSAAITTSGAIPITYTTRSSNTSVDDELRLKVRYKFEDLIVRTLLRLQVTGAISQAVYAALDLEDELYTKYLITTSKNTKNEFNSKDYTKHYSMLISNLKKSHNDQLILKLVSCELSIEDLLAMTAQQLADVSTQQKRQQERTNILKDAYRGISTQETIEARNRAVMGGVEEAWRTGGTQDVSALKSNTISSSISSNMDNGTIKLEDKKGNLLRKDKKMMNEDKNEIMKNDIEILPTSRSIEIENMVLNKSKDQSNSSTTVKTSTNKTSKRPLDVDAMSRFNIHSAHDYQINSLDKDNNEDDDVTNTTNRKHPKLSVEVDIESSTEAKKSIDRMVSKDSPRVMKPPVSLLNTLLANQSTNNKDKSKSKDHKTHSTSSTTPTNTLLHHDDFSGISYLPSTVATIKPSKLINSIGQHNITIIRPPYGGYNKNIILNAEGWITNSKLQGIIHNNCNIDGRVKLDEFVRIINKLLLISKDDKAAVQHRKHLSPLKFVIIGSSIPDSEASVAYNRFVDEFSKDERVGLCNMGSKSAASNVQLYILPPSLKNCLSIFDSFDKEESSSNSKDHYLYGVLTSKDVGPDKYTIADNIKLNASSTDALIVNNIQSIKKLDQDNAMKSIFPSTDISVIKPAPVPPPISTIAPSPTNIAAVTAVKPPPMFMKPPPIPTIAKSNVFKPPPLPPSIARPTIISPIISTTSITPVSTSLQPPIINKTSSILTNIQPDDPIYRVASFCAGRGVQAIRDLQAKSEARTVMPYVFEGHEDHPKFVAILKQLVEQMGSK